MMAVIVDRLLASMQPAWIEKALSHETAFSKAAIQKFVSENSECNRGKLTEYRTRATEEATACLGAYPGQAVAGVPASRMTEQLRRERRG